MAKPTGSSHAMDSAGDVVAASLRHHVADLRRWEAQLRLDHPDAVHHYRVATRRMRSILAAFRSLFEPDAGDEIAVGLRRAAAGISGARDAEAVRDRVEELFRLSPDVDAVLVRDARARLAHALDRSLDASRQVGLHHLDTPEYDDLVRRLVAFCDLPPWSPAAALPADVTLRPVMREEWDRFRKKAVRPLTSSGGRLEEPLMHEARKASKRARYAAEELVPVFGSNAAKMAKAAARVQTVLGDYRDSVITQRLLREVGEQGADDSHRADPLEHLRALEARWQDGFPEDLARVLADADRKALRRWVR